VPSDWLKFNTHTFTKDSRDEFHNKYKELLRKDTASPEALDYVEFSTLHEGHALQSLDQLCHVSYRHKDRTFTSQAWNRLFRIQKHVVREYVMEFMSSFKSRNHVVELDRKHTMVFQLGGVKKIMTMRQFILALELYTPEEVNNNLFEPFRDAYFRNRPNNYNPIEYFVGISTRNHYDTQYPPSYTTIKNPICRLVHRLLTLFAAGRHSAKEKVTLDDLFLLHSMDGRDMVVCIELEGIVCVADNSSCVESTLF
nr:hypothetical protein [Tanacetum cinerariifolium]